MVRASEVVADLRRARKGSTSTFRILAVTDGGAPNAIQRKQMNEVAMGGAHVKSAIITTAAANPIKRGIATAIQWLNPEFRIFAPQEAGRAFEHIGIAQAHVDSIWETLQSMQATMPPVEALRVATLQLGFPLPKPQAPPAAAASSPAASGDYRGRTCPPRPRASIPSK